MRGLWSVVYEFFREMFELDSRLFRTLKSLLFRPGHLSSEFSRNRRAAYMSPVRLYLFTSFLFFLVLSISAGGWLRNLDLSDAEVQMGAGDDPAAADSVRAVADSVLAAVDSALADRGLPAGLGLGALVDSVLAADSAQAGPEDTPAAAAEAQMDAGEEPQSQAIDPAQLEVPSRPACCPNTPARSTTSWGGRVIRPRSRWSAALPDRRIRTNARTACPDGSPGTGAAS